MSTSSRPSQLRSFKPEASLLFTLTRHASAAWVKCSGSGSVVLEISWPQVTHYHKQRPGNIALPTTRRPAPDTMAKYGVPVPSVAVKAPTRRNLAAVGLLAVIAMAALAVTHDSAAARGAPQILRDEVLPSPPRPSPGCPCACFTSRVLCPRACIDFY